jgi:hypothetical protein
MPNVSKVREAITRFEVTVTVVLRMSETSVAPRLCTAGPEGGVCGEIAGALTCRCRGLVRVVLV